MEWPYIQDWGRSFNICGKYVPEGVLPQLNRLERLRLNKEFSRVYTNGKSYANDILVLYALKNEKGFSRVGFSVGKRMGGAVERNRVKRRMKEALRRVEGRIPPGWDIILLPRTRIKESEFDKIISRMESLLRRAGLLEKEGLADGRASLPDGKEKLPDIKAGLTDRKDGFPER